MELWSDLVTPDELTEYARRDQEELYKVDSLVGLFPHKTTVGNTVSYVVTENGLVPTAEYRAFDAEASIAGKGQKGRKITLELPPLSQKDRIGELDVIKSRSLPEEVQRKSVAGTTSDVVSAVEARMELARGEVLENGRLTIEENGLYVDEDLGRDEDMTVSSTVPWDDPDALILDDLLDWAESYSDKGANGGAPGDMLGSRKVLGRLQRNLQILSAVSSVNTPALATVEQINAILDSHGLPRFRVYDRKVNVAGTVRRVLSAEKLFFAPTVGLGASVWGEAAEAGDPNYALQLGAEPGIVAAAHKSYDPYAFWVRATGVALPVLMQPNASMVAGVLSAE